MTLRHFHRNLNLVSYILLLLLVIQLGIYTWSLNRGFDFSDEAFAYLGFRNPEGIHHTATYYALVFTTFFGWLDLSVINVRIVRLILLLACGSILALGLIGWLNRKAKLEGTRKVNLFLYLILASLLINASGTQALTYNLASTLLLQCIVGSALYVFQRERQFNKTDAYIYCFIGAALFALFAVKASSAVLVSLTLLLLLAFDKQSIKPILIYSVILFSGGIGLAFLVFRSTLISWLVEYYETLTLLSGDTGGALLSRYADDIEYVTTSLLLAHVEILIGSIVLLLANRYLQRKAMRIICALLVTGLFSYMTYAKGFYLGGVRHYYTINFLYIAALFALFFSQTILIVIDRYRGKANDHAVFVMALFLFTIPFIGAAGTGNLLSIQITWYTSFLFAALYLLLSQSGPYLLNLFMVLLSINAMAQSVSGLIYYPYRINPLTEESHPFSAEIGAGNVLVNQSLQQSVDSAYRLLHTRTGYADGDPIFALSPEYGLIYFLKGTLPGWTWYNEKPTAANLAALKGAHLKNIDRTIFILPTNYEMDSAYRTCFRELNVDFPGNYANIGTIPYVIDNQTRPLTVFTPVKVLSQ